MFLIFCLFGLILVVKFFYFFVRFFFKFFFALVHFLVVDKFHFVFVSVKGELLYKESKHAGCYRNNCEQSRQKSEREEKSYDIAKRNKADAIKLEFVRNPSVFVPTWIGGFARGELVAQTIARENANKGV